LRKSQVAGASENRRDRGWPNEHDGGIWRGVGSAPTRSRRAVSTWASAVRASGPRNSRFGGQRPTRGAHDVEEPRKPRSCAADRPVGVRVARLLPRLKPHASGPDFICCSLTLSRHSRGKVAFSGQPEMRQAARKGRKKLSAGPGSKTCIGLRPTRRVVR